MRAKDRLEELRHLASHAGVYGDTVLALGPEKDAAGGFDDLLREVEQIRSWIHDIDRDTQLVRRLHSDPTFHTSRQLQEQLDAAVTRCGAAGLKASGALRQLAARARAAAGGGAGARAARLQYAATRRLYADALDRHLLALQQLRDYQLRLLRDQIKIVNLTMTDDECEHLLETNNVALFVDNLRAETAQARLALREAEARRDELARAEAALVAVRDLFAQLAHLVAAQQEQLDTVEYYALQATERVESGGHELLKGTVVRSKTRTKKLGLVICLVAGLLIVVLVLVAG